MALPGAEVCAARAGHRNRPRSGSRWTKYGSRDGRRQQTGRQENERRQNETSHTDTAILVISYRVQLRGPGMPACTRRGLRPLERRLSILRPAARPRGAPLGRRLPAGVQDEGQRPDGAVRRLPLCCNNAPPVHARRRFAAPILRGTFEGNSTMRLAFTLAGVSPLIMHNGVSMLSRARIEGRARPPRGVNPYIRAPAPTCTYDGRTSRPIPTSPPVSVRTDRGTTVPARDSDGRARRTRRPANPCTCRARSMTLILCGGLRKSGQSSTSRS